MTQAYWAVVGGAQAGQFAGISSHRSRAGLPRKVLIVPDHRPGWRGHPGITGPTAHRLLDAVGERPSQARGCPPAPLLPSAVGPVWSSSVGLTRKYPYDRLPASSQSEETPMLIRHQLPMGDTNNPTASVARQDRTAAQPPDEFRRVVRLKWRAGAWLPEPGWVLPLLGDGQAHGERWIVVSANRTDPAGWIEVELRRG